ncbi:leucine-rich repeat domain-containing protein [Xanthocytophaga flava]|uniref:leucine-rich repeat domain-containing protein n=1 Tax=Xanthocytophaga flava TaxID=3048013 RepID=UPI0028D6877E|nr:hypothetical protein [Xanthocytophaga flavus]MDJ1471071.1 hypothetical protein [Xanthocytophaga flavus]
MSESKLRVTSIAEGLKNPEEVKILDLKDQKITNLDLEIIMFSNLEELILDNNPTLYSLPDEIEYLPSLQRLSINQCSIYLLTQLKKIPTLRKLSCRKMKEDILEEKDKIYALTNLQELDISENEWRIEPSFGNLANLEVFIAEGCGISAIADDIANLTKLRKLSLRNNRLHTLPDKVFELPHLQTLLVTGKDNHLKSIGSRLQKLRQERSDFETDYVFEDFSTSEVSLSATVIEQLERLAIPHLSKKSKEHFITSKEVEYQVPSAIVQFLWEFDWNVSGLSLQWNEVGLKNMLASESDGISEQNKQEWNVDISATQANHLEVFNETTYLLMFGSWTDTALHQHYLVFDMNEREADPVVYSIDFEGEYESQGKLSEFLNLLDNTASTTKR